MYNLICSLYTQVMSKRLYIILVLLCAGIAAHAQVQKQDTLPSSIKGWFEDDYGIRYHITDTVWTQLPGMRYHILEWNAAGQWVLARNGEGQGKTAGLFTRIDVTGFTGMDPWLWGFCLSAYEGRTPDEALAVKQADRTAPRKGCNGFPFSRMKRIPEPAESK